MKENTRTPVLAEDELLLMGLAIEQSKSAYYRLAPDGTILYVNDFACQGLGYAKDEELVGKHVWEINPDFSPVVWASMWEELKANRVASFETHHQRRDGSLFPVRVTCNYISSQSQEYSFNFAQDISEPKRAQEALRDQENFFRLIAENISDFIAVLDLEGRRLYNSPSYRQFFGGQDDLIGTNSFVEVHSDDRDGVIQVFRDTVQTGVGHQIEYRFVRPDGQIHHMESRGDVIRDGDGKVVSVIVVSQDITERKRMEARMQRLAHYDVLTDLPNRALMSDRLQQAMGQVRRDGGLLAVMFLDLDRFKPVNDALGHEVGDLLLVQVAQRLQGCVKRETDTVSRIGGDEFVILLASIKEANEAAVVAGKVLQALNEPFMVGQHQISISSSVGIAVYPLHGDDMKQLIKHADRAMYHAKDAGHNCFRFYTTDQA